MPDEVEVETVINDQPANDNVGEEITVDHSGDVTEMPSRAEVEAKVSAGLEAVFGDDATPETDEVTDDKPEEIDTPVDEPNKDEAEAADELEEKVDEQPEPQTQSPTLPAEFRRSLKAYGWSDEEIDSNTKQLGVKFLETAQKLHANRSAEVSKWAELGRAEKQRQAEANKAVKRPDPYAPVDVDGLKKVYGENQIIDELSRINAILPIIKEAQEASERARTEALSKQIDGFFNSKEIQGSYKDFYGTPGQELTQEQANQCNKVLEIADSLMAGAKMQGRKISLDDAMTAAHDSVSSEYKEQAVRKTITKQLKTRAKSVSLKPGGVKSAPAKGSPKADLEKRVAQGLAAVFNR